MKLHQLPRTTQKKQKRLGRGYGSGKGGHTAGRGQKGQKSRSKVRLLFEGTKMRKSFLQRMPMLRGKRKLKSFNEKPLVIKLKDLELLPANTRVTTETLIKAGIINLTKTRSLGVKILRGGKLTKKLIVALPVSAMAAKVIEKVGGKIEIPVEENKQFGSKKKTLAKKA